MLVRIQVIISLSACQETESKKAFGICAQFNDSLGTAKDDIKQQGINSPCNYMQSITVKRF